MEPSPLAPKRFPRIPEIAGVTLAGRHVGLKPDPAAKDLMVASLARGTTIAGVFTTSRCPSAPVDWCREILSGGQVRAIVVNSGNANAFTGNAGDRVVDETVRAAARAFGCPRRQVFVASTGVIGEPVPPDYIAAKLPRLIRDLKPRSWPRAAEAPRGG